jgi:hypothetical protein
MTWSGYRLEERKQLSRAVNKMVADLKARQGFRKGLRIKGIQGHEGIYEMTWAPDGRASFTYGTSPNAGDCTYRLAESREPRHSSRPMKINGVWLNSL